MQLFKNIYVADHQSSYNGKQVDIRISNGKIEAISTDLSPKDGETVTDFDGAMVSPGFLDIGPYLGDPGHEDREDLESLSQAARRGGYTSVAPLPDANPVRHDKSGISYLLQNAKDLAVKILPLGAVSQNLEGQDITEMIDMQRAGAIAFTDGPKSIASSGLMSRALHYVKTFDGLVINAPFSRSLSPHGQLHEGEVSTRMGLPGIPTISEQLMLYRDLELADYADSRLLTHLVSTATAVKMLADARKKGLKVTASVAVLNLQFTDEVMSNFDPNFKVLPPLRAESDRTALIQGLKDGVIDCIVSNHQAHEPEQKSLEFAYADFGCTSLQSCFAQAVTVLKDDMDAATVAALFSHGPRQALGLPKQSIEVDMPAELTFFQFDQTSTFQLHPTTEKGRNNGLIGHDLTGGPIATYVNNQLHFCNE